MHDEPIFFNDKIIGYSTSSNYSFNYKKNIFLAYVDNNYRMNNNLKIEIAGKQYGIKHEPKSLYDPEGKILRN